MRVVVRVELTDKIHAPAAPVMPLATATCVAEVPVTFNHITIVKLVPTLPKVVV